MTWFWIRITVWSSLHELVLISRASHGSGFESPVNRVHNEYKPESPVTGLYLTKRVQNAVPRNHTHIIYTHAHLYIHITYSYIHSSVHNTYTYMYTTHTNSCTHIIHIYIHILYYIPTHAYTSYTHINSHICIHTYTHNNIYTYMHTTNTHP